MSYFYSYFCSMKKIIITIILLCAVLNVSSQRVGLVLSGGGAKGLYHVGMLKALEDNGIPIDYVAGASMGAIVGGMYAVGYSPEEMIKFFITDSVSTWLEGKMPEEYEYYYTRFAPNPEIISLKINPDTTKIDALSLPTNIISPYRIDMAFISMVMPASCAANNNFDSLMVPFRCVASDVYNKKLVVLKDGSLPFAIRASMTIPLVFKPLMLDSVLLYDGGVYNNFPWQTLDEDFQPDIYIGGICAGNYENPSRNDIVSQVSVMVTQKTDYNLPDSTDITIKRRFDDVTMLDYSRAAYIMARGYEDAMAQMPEILKKIKRRVTKEEIAAKRQAFKNKIKPLLYESVEIEGLTQAQKFYVMRQLGIRDNQLITSEYFEEKYMKVLATGVFTGEFPEVTYNSETGFFRIKLTMQTQPNVTVSLGGNLSSTAFNQLFLGFKYQHVGKAASTYDLFGSLGSYYSGAGIRARHDMYTRFPFYLTYALGVNVIDRDAYNSVPYYRNKEWRAKEHTDFYFRTSFAVPFIDNSKAFRAHLDVTRSKDKYFPTFFISTDTPNEFNFTSSTATVEIESKSLNYMTFPTKGVSQFIKASYTMGLEELMPGDMLFHDEPIEIKGRNRSWFHAQFRREQYLKINSWVNLGYLVDVNFSTHPDFGDKISTALTQPAFEPTLLSKTIFMPEYRSDAYVGLGLMPVFNLNKKQTFYLSTFIYAFLPQEILYEKGWQRLTSKRMDKYTEFIIGGTLVYQTIAGPVSLNVTKFSTGNSNWNFSVNFGYMLFSK